jgi:creatinine amidohydrolase/Fe(II)-dependent formamide hydrolase-like protein
MRFFAEMNREELRTAAPESMAVLPIGATEQHGPHLPTGTDVFAVETVAREAAAQLTDDVPVIVTPTLRLVAPSFRVRRYAVAIHRDLLSVAV